MAFPESLIVLAGFVLAHAAWSVSDLPEGDLLIPFAVVEISDDRQLIRFEAGTQAESIKQGKAYLADPAPTTDAWVFAREGQYEEEGRYIHVLTIEAKAKETEAAIIFFQRFQPFAEGKFRLLGSPMVVVDGEIIADSEADPLLAQLHQGIQSHEGVVPLWPEWVSE